MADDDVQLGEVLMAADPCPDRPPTGVKPRVLADEERLKALMEAWLRYRNANMHPPQEWVDEIHYLTEPPY